MHYSFDFYFIINSCRVLLLSSQINDFCSVSEAQVPTGLGLWAGVKQNCKSLALNFIHQPNPYQGDWWPTYTGPVWNTWIERDKNCI